jgi:hypothetical protein
LFHRSTFLFSHVTVSKSLLGTLLLFPSFPSNLHTIQIRLIMIQSHVRTNQYLLIANQTHLRTMPKCLLPKADQAKLNGLACAKSGRRRVTVFDAPSRLKIFLRVAVSAQNGCRRDLRFFAARDCLGVGASDVSAQNKMPLGSLG